MFETVVIMPYFMFSELRKYVNNVILVFFILFLNMKYF